jgi:histidine ammonia-lyase
MGANAATKNFRVIENLERIFAIELFTSAQALEFRRPAKSSPAIEKIVSDYRKEVKYITEDVVMYDKIETTIKFLQSKLSIYSA